MIPRKSFMTHPLFRGAGLPTRRLMSWRTLSAPRTYAARRVAFSTTDTTTPNTEWRQRQLQKLHDKFEAPAVVEQEEDLQQMWREMEGRVTRRRPRTVEEMGGKTGRTNIKSTDEEYWMREGLYDGGKEDDNESSR